MYSPEPVHAPGITRRVQQADILVMPGQLWFGDGDVRVKTLLGSCVAVTLWHPRRRVGGMCHYLLPKRERQPGQARDGKYGTEAVEMLIQALRGTGAKAAEFECHLYGGADTMPDAAGAKFNVGERNIEQAWNLIEQYGLELQGVDVGDNVPRTVILDVGQGLVECHRGRSHK